MRRFGWWLGRVLLFVAVLVILMVWVLPRERIERTPITADLSDPAAYLATREAAFDDIVPGTEARVVWAGEQGTETGTVILYLHGFSATSEEIRPVPDNVADAIGANLVYARLRGHGRSGDALAEARAGDWIDDTALFLDVARAVGDRVIIIGTSTGATLAAYAMTEPAMAADVAGVAMLSPNFALANPAGVLLDLPYARHWVPLVAGAERQFDTLNDDHATYWTDAYPTVATVSLGTLLRAVRDRDYSGVTTPALFVLSDQDRVISAPAARAVAEAWGGPVTVEALELPEEGADPFSHVIAGDILSPAMTEPVTDLLLNWVDALP